MARTGSRSRRLLAHAARVALVAALVGVMVPTGVPAARAAGTTYWVDNVSGSDADAGTEDEPFETITYALSQADGTDTIMVKPGTYSEANNESMPIQIFDGETLVSTAGAASTIIQGANGKMLLVVNGWQDGDRLEGFTFTGGGAGGSPGVLVNLQTVSGGVVPPLIAGNVFSHNDVSNGGAITISSPTDGTATAIEVHGNIFSDNVGSGGGGLKYDGFGAIDVIGNAFTNNEANAGGALWLRTDDAVCTVSDNSFMNNAATGGGNVGGAMFWDGRDSSVRHTIEFNTFSANTAATAGGAMVLAQVKVHVDSNFGSYNSTLGSGGFGFVELGDVTAENNYFTGHSATTYGSVWELQVGSSLAERNDTLWAQAAGPQTTHMNASGSALTVTNCIYWNPNCANELERASVSYTCSYSDSTELSSFLNTVGPGMVYAHPQVNTGLGLGKLEPTSPCIDVANPANCPSDDYYETARPQGSAPDIGCYEMPVAHAPVYRFYNFTNNTHFFTPSAEEADGVIARYSDVFRYEGICYYTNPANNTQPLYRFYNRVSASHFYTASAEEAAHIIATWPHIYSLDGQTYAVNPAPVPNSAPVYRFYNLRNGSHFYTASAEEADMVIATWPTVYRFEGPAFWIGL